MKYTNEASIRTAVSYGCRLEDDVNGITKVFAVSREEAANFAPEKVQAERNIQK